MSTDAPVTNSLDAERIEALIDARFPQIHSGGRSLVIEEVGDRSARVRLLHHERHIRPGGTVSGPAMFTLADFAVYVAIMATLGEVGLDAVTTNMNINFLAKPEPRDLVAESAPDPARSAAGRRRGRDPFGRCCRTWSPMPSPPTRCRRASGEASVAAEVLRYRFRIWLIFFRFISICSLNRLTPRRRLD